MTDVKIDIILLSVAGKKDYTQRAKVRELIEHLSPAEIGGRLGISRQRVYQILSDEEVDYLPLNQRHRLQRRISRNLARSLGPEIAYVDRHTRGAISELLVAADLMALGWKPYVPLFRNHSHDIIASKGGMLITIEVRSALRREDASIVASLSTAGRVVDHFAFVLPDEPVVYKPELAIIEEPRKIRQQTFTNEQIKECTRAGLARARAQGRVGGRRPTFTEEQIRAAIKMRSEPGVTWQMAADSIGISIPSLQRRIKCLPTN